MIGLRRFLAEYWGALLAIGLACLVLAIVLVFAERADPRASRPGACPDARAAVVFYGRAAARHRFRLAQARTSLALLREASLRDCARVRLTAKRTRTRARTLRTRYRVWLVVTLERWRCIHEHEAPPWSGAWRANTGNGYFGGLQMDRDFQAAYGPEYLRRWGTANRWPVWAQLRAAERARAVRGFDPWPNTARACGLL